MVEDEAKRDAMSTIGAFIYALFVLFFGRGLPFASCASDEEPHPDRTGIVDLRPRGPDARTPTRLVFPHSLPLFPSRASVPPLSGPRAVHFSDPPALTQYGFSENRGFSKESSPDGSGREQSRPPPPNRWRAGIGTPATSGGTFLVVPEPLPRIRPPLIAALPPRQPAVLVSLPIRTGSGQTHPGGQDVEPSKSDERREGGPAGRGGREGDLDYGVDTKAVRRTTATKIEPYRTGSTATALDTASDPKRLRQARRQLRAKIYSGTTCGPRLSRIRTMKRILKRAGHRWLPVTPRALQDLVASLHAARHRSIPNYVGDWRREHVRAGHPWTEGLVALRKDLIRAASRGQGPPQRAPTFGAERLPTITPGDEAPRSKGGPRWPWLMVVVGISWLLRGAESADLLGEQAAVDPGVREASLDLCATKMDPQGRGCIRSLRCLCDTGLQGPCPYCALERLLELRKAAGLGAKDPLFPTRRGVAPTPKAVVATLTRILGQRATEHTPRREGAQMLTRRDVPLYLTQFLGRWGGPTVAKYAGEAMRGQLARAASSNAAGLGAAGTDLATRHLRTTIQQLIKEALDEREDEATAGEKLQLALTASPAGPGAPLLPSGVQVQGMRKGRAHGQVHDVVLSDQALPVELWVTACSWSFGRADHFFPHGAATTCARCLSKRTLAARAAEAHRGSAD